MSESLTLQSISLGRTVRFDIYKPAVTFTGAEFSDNRLLLCNDGQDLVTMNFDAMVNPLFEQVQIKQLIVVGIHCGDDRLNEYGMASSADYKGRGSKGAAYQRFVLEELLPAVHLHLGVTRFVSYAYAGFSLGGLSAIDIAWNNPGWFNTVGVFSGSFWWRSKSQDASDYHPNKHRLMHRQLRESEYRPGMKFFFQCGELDETEDRDKNGVIDSIDDTFDIIKILVRMGYKEGPDIRYLQIPDGRHDVPTWARALPIFLIWGWGANK